MIGQDIYSKVSLVMALGIVGIFAVDNGLIKGVYLEEWYKAVLWIIFIGIIHYRLPQIHLSSKRKYISNVYVWAFNCGVAMIVSQLVMGTIVEFGKSPYNHTLKGILFNVICIGASLIGREMIRSYIIHTALKRRKYYVIGLMIVLMTLTSMSILSFTRISDVKSLIIFVGERLLPEVCTNILATYLVIYGGAGASIIYIGLIEGFEWLSPILPNLTWLIRGVVGIVVPGICTMIISEAYGRISKDLKKSEEVNKWKMIPTGVLCVIFIWFVAGVFPVYPSAIATGSMEPHIYPGDVVVVRKIQSMEDLERLQVGDVIQFISDQILINHRIIEVVEEDGKKSFRTKGDNNSVEDRELVGLESVRGVIVEVIPKVGWPTLVLKGNSNEAGIEVEF